jgi:thiamine biosynthesis protein ThiS
MESAGCTCVGLRASCAQTALNQGLTLTCRECAQYAGRCSQRPLLITLNGEPYELDRPVSIDELLTKLSIDARRVAVEHNLTILKRKLFTDTVVQEGDRIEIVNFVGGG